MANHPKKMKDPTEAALSAIQEALNIRDDAPTIVAEPVATVKPNQSERRRNNRAASTEHDLFKDESADQEPAGDPQTSVRRAANDDRESIGQILRTLQRRPPRTSYVLATVFTVAWAAAAFGLAW